jgi:hypothetical protein
MTFPPGRVDLGKISMDPSPTIELTYPQTISIIKFTTIMDWISFWSEVGGFKVEIIIVGGGGAAIRRHLGGVRYKDVEMYRGAGTLEKWCQKSRSKKAGVELWAWEHGSCGWNKPKCLSHSFWWEPDFVRKEKIDSQHPRVKKGRTWYQY